MANSPAGTLRRSARPRFTGEHVPHGTSRPQLTAVPSKGLVEKLQTAEVGDVVLGDAPPYDEAGIDRAFDIGVEKALSRETTSASDALLGQSSTQVVSLAASSLADLDTLWDWARQDRDGVQAFTGTTFAHSPELFEWARRIFGLEHNQQALFRSIRRDNALVGFVMLLPIVRAEGKAPVGTAHIYLSQATRGDMPELLPSLLSNADALVPGMMLTVITPLEAWASMLMAQGFSKLIVLSRPSSLAGEPHGS